jgi:predicted amidohydrolase YtcJ
MFAAAIVLLAVPVFARGSRDKNQADRIYTNGNVYTVDGGFSRAEAIAIRGDRIVYVGTSANALSSYRGSATEVVDLGGGTVIPGLIDSHLHYQMIGSFLDRIDIFQKSKAEILALVAAEAARLGPGKWILSMGWNNVLWGEDYPTTGRAH